MSRSSKVFKHLNTSTVVTVLYLATVVGGSGEDREGVWNGVRGKRGERQGTLKRKRSFGRFPLAPHVGRLYPQG